MSAVQNIKKLNDIYYPVGAVGDGVTNDRAAIQAAIDAANLAGGGLVVIPPPPKNGFYRLTRALQIKDNVTIWVTAPTTRIVSDSSEAGVSWPFYGTLLFSSIGSNLSEYESYAADDVTQGDLNVTLTTSSDSSNFLPGDVVLVATAAAWGAANIPAWGQMNVVEEISTGSLKLRHGIDSTETGIVVYKLSRTSVVSNGYTLNAVKDAAVIGGTWEAPINGSKNAPSIIFGAMIDCRVDIHRMVGWNGFPYGNLMFNCDLKTVSSETFGRGVELAFLSGYNTVDIGTMLMSENLLPGGGPPSGIVWLNEGSKANNVKIRNVNAGITGSTNLIHFANTSRNTVEIDSAVCNSNQVRGLLVQPATTAGSPGCYDNVAKVRWASLPSAQFFASFDGTGEGRNTLSNSSFIGTVSTNAVYLNGGSGATIENCYFQDGSIQLGSSENYTIKNVTCADKIPVASNSVQNYASKGAWLGVFDGARSGSVRLMEPEYTVSGVATTNRTLTIPAGAMTHGCAIDYEMVVVSTGAGGTKEVNITAGGSTIATHTIASGTVTSKIKGRLVPSQSLSGLWFETRRMFGTSEETSVGSVSVTLGSSWDLVFSVNVPTGGDSCQVRVLKAVFSNSLDPVPL